MRRIKQSGLPQRGHKQAGSICQIESCEPRTMFVSISFGPGDIEPPLPDLKSDVFPIFNANGSEYFLKAPFYGSRELWKTDGTPEGAEQVSSDINVNFPSDIAHVDNTVYYINAGNTRSLQKIDLAQPDVSTTIGGFQPRELVAMNGKVFFTTYSQLAPGSTTDRETYLCVSDGTPAGTHHVFAIRGTAPDYSPPFENMIVSNGRIYFVARKTDNKCIIYASDGTAAGTKAVRSIDGWISNLTPYKDGIAWAYSASRGYNSATEPPVTSTPHAESLWYSNGTMLGTLEIGPELHNDLRSNVDSYLWTEPNTNSGLQLSAINGIFYLAGRGETWAFANGKVSKLIDMHPTEFGEIDGKFVFSQYSIPQGDLKTFASDGTAQGTSELKLVPGPGNDVIVSTIKENATDVYFSDGKDLYRRSGQKTVNLSHPTGPQFEVGVAGASGIKMSTVDGVLSGPAELQSVIAMGGRVITGDWNGDGLTDFGAHLGSTFYLDANANRKWDGIAGGDQQFKFGRGGDIPVVGDWNGDGRDNIGVFEGNKFLLDTDGNHVFASGDDTFFFGNSNDTPIAGDWNGDGKSDVGVWRSRYQAYLDFDGSHAWDESRDASVYLGDKGQEIIVGDWNGDGKSDLGVFNGTSFFLDSNGSYGYDEGIDRTYILGKTGDKPIAGIWI